MPNVRKKRRFIRSAIMPLQEEGGEGRGSGEEKGSETARGEESRRGRGRGGKEG